MNTSPEREAHLRHLAGTDNAMRDAMAMVDQARESAESWQREAAFNGARARVMEYIAASAPAPRTLRDLDLDHGGARSAHEPEHESVEPSATAPTAPHGHDAGHSVDDLAAPDAGVRDGVGGEGGHEPEGSP